jgi:hypothetical protein
MGPFPNQGNNIPQNYQLMQPRKIIRFQLSSLTSMQTKLSIDTTTKQYNREKTLKEKSKSHPQENFKKNKNQKKENFVIDQ